MKSFQCEETQRSPQLPQRFYSLDVLRGLGALVIIFTHWSNFFFYEGSAYGETHHPFAFLLWPVYEEGWRAVDLFFCLSGFVFFWLYSEKITSQVTGSKEFLILRFSRLYPLHLITLLLVAFGQWLMLRFHGVYFGATANDVGHFVAQLFFMSAWGFRDSFNTPAWSVSVEILLYLVFFLVCRFGCIRWWQLLIYVGVGDFCCVHHGAFLQIFRGVLSFFVGGLAFKAYSFSQKFKISTSLMMWLGATAVLLWVLVPLEVRHNYISTFCFTAFGNVNSSIPHLIGHFLLRLEAGLYVLVLFPYTLWFLATWETRRGTLGRRASFLGDLSYSSYLIHYPLQMLFVLLAFFLGIKASFWGTAPAILIFFSVLIPVSICSYRYFERPMQSFLRKKLQRLP